MREPTYLILLALADEPLHGYAIIREIETISARRTTLSAGTLYAALDRLSESGWVATSGEEVVDGRHRRYYRLTDAGRDAVTAETERLSAMARVARTRLRGRPGLAT